MPHNISAAGEDTWRACYCRYTSRCCLIYHMALAFFFARLDDRKLAPAGASNAALTPCVDRHSVLYPRNDGASIAILVRPLGGERTLQTLCNFQCRLSH